MQAAVQDSDRFGRGLSDAHIAGAHDAVHQGSGLGRVDQLLRIHADRVGGSIVTTVVSLFGILGRFAGDLLTSALGWASSLLFGRVPRSHQIFLVLMMAGSFLWIAVVVGLLLPSVASFLLTATPHPSFVDRAWLAATLLFVLIVLPLFVGLGGYLVPAEGERPVGAAALREILRGYLLAPLISGLLVFLAGVGLTRKVRSWRHRWVDTHVPIVVKPDGYQQLVVDLQNALASAGLATTAEEAPWVLTVPARLLTRVAGGNVRRLRADRLIELTGPDMRIGVYPSDIAISGVSRNLTRTRAAIVSRLATTSAHLTTSAEAQEMEDRLGRLVEPDGLLADGARAAFAGIDARLLELPVPTDEWDILYRMRLQLERDLLLGATPGTAFPGHQPDPPGVATSPTSTVGAQRTTAPLVGAAASPTVVATPRATPTSSRRPTVHLVDRP